MAAGYQLTELIVGSGKKIGTNTGRTVQRNLTGCIAQFNVHEFNRYIRMQLCICLPCLLDELIRSLQGFPDDKLYLFR